MILTVQDSSCDGGRIQLGTNHKHHMGLKAIPTHLRGSLPSYHREGPRSSGLKTDKKMMAA